MAGAGAGCKGNAVAEGTPWDSPDRKFADEAVHRQGAELQADDLATLTTRRKGKLLVLDVGARITSANQK